MSYSMSKMFCKVCQDAGKPLSVYTSHYIRTKQDINGNSVVTCPTLLQTECRFCHEKGHTTNYCPILAGKKKYMWSDIYPEDNDDTHYYRLR